MQIQGVLVTGNIAHDTLTRAVEKFQFGTTTWVDSLIQQLGGNGGNTSYTLGMMGVPVKLVGLVGNDLQGDQLMAILRGGNVDVTQVKRSSGPTSATVVIVNRAGDRMFLHRPGSSGELMPDPPDFASLAEGVSHFHLANPFALPNLRRHGGETLRRARAAGLTTSVDMGWDALGEWMKVIEPYLPHVDIFFANHDEARMLSGSSDPDEGARFLQERGVRDVVIKMAQDGSRVYTRDAIYSAAPFAIDAIDSTGAGDCYVGGFLAALHRGAGYEEAARFGNAVGAVSVSALGAITGVRGWDETHAWMAER